MARPAARALQGFAAMVLRCIHAAIDRSLETQMAIALLVLVPLACTWSHARVRTRGIPFVLMAVCCVVIVGGSCTLGFDSTELGWRAVADAAVLLDLMLLIEIVRARFRAEALPRAVVKTRREGVVVDPRDVG